MGGFFQALNNGLSPEEDVPAATASSSDASQSVPEEPAPYQLSLVEAYSEGGYLYARLKLKTEDAGLLSALWLSPDSDSKEEEYSITVNGQSARLLNSLVFGRGEDGFDGKIRAALPFPAENGQKLAVELRLNKLCGAEDDSSQSERILDVEVERPVSLSFEVTADTSENRSGKTVMTADDVTFLGFESTPLYFKTELSYPAILQTPLSRDAGTVHVEARTDTGEELTGAYEADEGPELGTISLGEKINHTAAFVNVPDTTEKVIVTLYNTHSQGVFLPYVDGGVMGACVFAEFTVDLNSGEVTATDTYLERGYEKVPILEYTAIMESGPQFVDHMFDHEVTYGHGRVCFPEEETQEADYSESDLLQWTIFFYCDTAEELLYEARFYVDGELYRSVPLFRTEDSVNTETGYLTVCGEFGLEVKEIDPQKDGLPDVVKRIYHARVYLEGYSEGLDGFDGTYQILNTDTGEVLFDSAEYERPKHYFWGSESAMQESSPDTFG